MNGCMYDGCMDEYASVCTSIRLSICLSVWMDGCLDACMTICFCCLFWIHDFILVFIDGVCATNFLRVLCGNVTMIMTMI